MKIQIRNNVFETNSSSSHSLVIGTDEEFDLFKKNELVIDMETKRFIKPKVYESEEAKWKDDDPPYVFPYSEIGDFEEETEIDLGDGKKIKAAIFEYPY